MKKELTWLFFRWVKRSINFRFTVLMYWLYYLGIVKGDALIIMKFCLTFDYYNCNIKKKEESDIFMKRFKKSRKVLYVIVSCLFYMFMTEACSNQPHSQPDIVIFDSGMQAPAEEERCADVENIAAIYREICAEMIATDTVNRAEIMQKIVGKLGEKGYAAVDGENQIDMTNAEQVLSFCRAVDAKEKAELTII